MKRIISLGLFAVVTAGSITQSAFAPKSLANPTNSQKPAASSSTQHRDVFYLSQRFGFRFVSPKGYVIHTIDTKPSQPDTPIQRVEIWQQADFLNRDSLPESPPIISITTYNNSRRLPLKNWKGELSHNDDRPLTVAGQAALAYTSTGLYESDNVLVASPDGKHVFRLKVGYLGAKDDIRKVFQDVVSSFTFDVLPNSNSSSQQRINYDRLKSLLAANNWQAADAETRGILQRLAGPKGDLLFSSKSVINSLPCNDLLTLDSLWSQASKGRFGYSAQQRIWQKTQATKPTARVEQFGQTVGWRRSQPLPEKNQIGMELSGTQWRLDSELKTSAAPVGQFPWAGVSSSRLTDMLSEIGCGSCTIDAMYLVNDRYYDYVPTLFTKLNQCRRR